MAAVSTYHGMGDVLILSTPLVVGGILHMVAVKKDVLSYFKKPVHQRWFGLNKTWRGFLVMPLATLPGVWLARGLDGILDQDGRLLEGHSSLALALALGLGYCLAELPNSFLKRRLGVPEGEAPRRHRWAFVLLDQGDSVLGCLLAYKVLLGIPWSTFIITAVFGTIIHLVINLSLYGLGLRKNPF